MHRFKLSACGLAAALLFAIAPPLQAAATSIVITDEVQLGLGDAFMADGEYYRAVTEYMRFLYLFPTAEQTPYALLQIGMAHYHGGEYQRAIDSFAKVRATYSAAHFTQAALYEGICYNRLKLPAKAREAFEKAVAFDAVNRYAPDALIGKALTRISQGDLAGGETDLGELPQRYPADPRAEDVATAVERIGEFRAKPLKSSLLAGSMSAVVPGSGQMYAGNYKDGLMALLVNGLFITGTLVAIDQENYATAAIVGGLGVPFYLGNIYGAANAARKWNLSLRKDLHEQLAITLDYRY